MKKVNGQSVAEPPCFPISPLESFAPLEALGRSSQSKSRKVKRMWARVRNLPKIKKKSERKANQKLLADGLPKWSLFAYLRKIKSPEDEKMKIIDLIVHWR